MAEEQKDEILKEQEAGAESVEETEADTQAADAEKAKGAEAKESSEKGSDAKPTKKLKTDKKQEALKEKIAELEDKTLRQMAEFDNFRKRTEREKAQMFETGAKSVIEKILPVVDNFERGLATCPEGDSFAEGMAMVYRQLMDELDKMEVKPIEAVGQEFNPDLHNAVMQVESEEYESGVVAQELQKGYTYRGSVVRHSMVAVVS